MNELNDEPGNIFEILNFLKAGDNFFQLELMARKLRRLFASDNIAFHLLSKFCDRSGEKHGHTHKYANFCESRVHRSAS